MRLVHHGMLSGLVVSETIVSGWANVWAQASRPGWPGTAANRLRKPLAVPGHRLVLQRIENLAAGRLMIGPPAVFC
jgi:hypothetical protein